MNDISLVSLAVTKHIIRIVKYTKHNIITNFSLRIKITDQPIFT